MNHIPYIRYEVTNCQLMDVNPINKRRFIEEQVYDELFSTNLSEEIDYDYECKNFKIDEIISVRKSKNSLSICTKCLFLISCILISSLS
jgi:hypothetical protein